MLLPFAALLALPSAQLWPGPAVLSTWVPLCMKSRFALLSLPCKINLQTQYLLNPFLVHFIINYFYEINTFDSLIIDCTRLDTRLPFCMPSFFFFLLAQLFFCPFFPVQFLNLMNYYFATKLHPLTFINIFKVSYCVATKSIKIIY